ncbi:MULTISPECIES: acyl-CoA dehydrogenase family protein [unclassified Rhodococcus (in: high G+C Gram-positive bacteria)]|uniref:acyl-CoA dehydrogenase family protein n=1 Tax=unclassified Rhodococcus (in: high G+C Gram-positive bacteria) TaxID=192944 RepID=UPI00096A91AD|nr:MULTISPECIES: acyl-CoA dehydrogenase family protein [unclassified Rhodococcus (in: high G+C Gram-positive bacteria)]
MVSVANLLPDIAAAAAETERTRRPADNVMASLAAAGIFRMMQPRAHGGAEASPIDTFSTIREISSACASTGWIAGAMCLNSWMLPQFGESAMTEIWGEDPSALIAGAYIPTGQLRPDGPDYRLSGRWRAITGGHHCHWLIVGVLIPNNEGIMFRHALVLVPRADATFVDAAGTVGLAAVATHDVIIENVLVPAHRVCSPSRRADVDNTRHLRSLPALYRHSVTALYCTAVMAPLIGAGQGAYAAMLDQWNVANTLTRTADPITALQGIHDELGRASFEIDTAVLQMERDLTDLHAVASKAKQVPTELFVRVRRNQVLSVELMSTAVDRLVKIAGRRGMAVGHPVQRAWRDVHTGATNRANREPDAVALFARCVLGFDVDHSETTPVI